MDPSPAASVTVTPPAPAGSSSVAVTVTVSPSPGDDGSALNASEVGSATTSSLSIVTVAVAPRA